MNKNENIEVNSIRKDIEDYLSDSLKEMDRQIIENDKLYNKVHREFDNILATATHGSTRDSIEIANTLTKIRSTGVDAADKKFKAKLEVLKTEIAMKKTKIEETSTTNNDFLISSINEILNNNFSSKDFKIDNNNYMNQQSNNKLDEIIEKKIANNEITITSNDQKGLNKYLNSTGENLNEQHNNKN